MVFDLRIVIQSFGPAFKALRPYPCSVMLKELSRHVRLNDVQKPDTCVVLMDKGRIDSVSVGMNEIARELVESGSIHGAVYDS